MSLFNMDSSANGFNPIRWDCDNGRNCFNKKMRPKIEVFSECFPGRINFGDVDAIVEINGFGLMLEWKTNTNKAKTGQRIMYERLTKSKLLTVLLVVGDAETMQVSHMGVFYNGKQSELIEATLDDVKKKIKAWVKWVSQPKETGRTE